MRFSPTSIRRLLPLTLLLAALTACSAHAKHESNAGPDAVSASPTLVQTINVSLNPEGCDPLTLSLAAGPATFNLSNKGSSTVSEFEVQDSTNLLGEAEAIVPGIDHSFSLTLEPGTYTTYCPGGTGAVYYGTLTVAATNAPVAVTAASDQQQRAVESYRAYLKAQTEQLVATTKPFVDAVKAGDMGQSKLLYAIARGPYERIEPVAETFLGLDPDIDARENDVAAGGEWTGFHRLEKAIWQDNSLAGMSEIAQKLLDDVTSLDRLVGTVKLQPATIANGAVDLLNEISTGKITGEEERYSHLDLIDFAANLEGAQQAFEAVQPLLAARDDTLARQITQRFAATKAALDTYRLSSGGFVTYAGLTKDDTRKLAALIDALAEPLSRVARAVLS